MMKRGLSKWLVPVVTACVMGVLLSGCAWSIGDKSGAAGPQATRGAELIDLKKARDQGAMTEEEYQAQRNKVLSR